MTSCNCRGGPNCCMRRGVPAPLPPDQIKPLPPSVGIYEGEGGARKAPPPPPPAPEGFAVPEIRSPLQPIPPRRLPADAPNGFAIPEKLPHDHPLWRPGALRRFLRAMVGRS